MSKFKETYLYTLLFFLINSTLLTKYDESNIALSAITLISIFQFLNYPEFKNCIKSRPVILWLCLMLYYYISAIIRGNPITEYNIISVSIIEVGLMTIIPFLYKINSNQTLLTICLSLVFFSLFGYAFSSMGDDGRLRSFIHVNQMAQICGVACICISLLISLRGVKWSYYILYIMPIVVLILCGSRNGLLLLATSLLILVVPYMRRLKIFQLLFLIIGIAYAYSLTSDLLIIQRLTEEEVYSEFITGTFLDSIFGDRAIYYLMGFSNFLENPLFGIGLLNFMDYNRFGWWLHSEPMTHLAEGGLIGASIYLLFIIYFIKHLWRKYQYERYKTILFSIAFIAVIVVGLTARIYMYHFFFIIYALLIAFLDSKYNIQFND